MVGFAGGFRRSELVALEAADLRFEQGGVVIRIRRAKTDQLGEGANVALPYGSNPATCPVRNLRAWIEAAGIRWGSRHDHSQAGDVGQPAP